MVDLSFGTRIKKKRILFGYSLTELGEKIDCSGPYLSGIERGTKTPSKKMIEKLSEALEIEFSELDQMAKIIKMNRVEKITKEEKKEIIIYYKSRS